MAVAFGVDGGNLALRVDVGPVAELRDVVEAVRLRRRVEDGAVRREVGREVVDVGDPGSAVPRARRCVEDAPNGVVQRVGASRTASISSLG